MNRTWLIRLVVLGFFALAVVVVLAQNNEAFQKGPRISPSPAVDVNPTFEPEAPDSVGGEEPQEASQSQEVTGSKTFTSQTMGLSLVYPSDLRLTNNSPTEVRFFKAGPTQQQGTEIYDGISVTFQTGTYSQAAFADFVKAQQQKVQEDGVSTITSPTKPVTIAGISGYEFSSRGLGDFRHIYLPKGERDYVYIVDSTVDPQNKSNFKTTVSRMLNSITIEE
jgi:hypothetical protein